MTRIGRYSAVLQCRGATVYSCYSAEVLQCRAATMQRCYSAEVLQGCGVGGGVSVSTVIEPVPLSWDGMNLVVHYTVTARSESCDKWLPEYSSNTECCCPQRNRLRPPSSISAKGFAVHRLRGDGHST